MALGRLSFNSRNRGKQPRANVLLRAGRMLRIKRLSFANDGLTRALDRAERKAVRVRQLAAAHRVPMDPLPALPSAPKLPGREWVEFLADMGTLREPVKPQAEPDPRDAVPIAWNGPAPT